MALQWKRTSATVAYEAVVFNDDDDEDDDDAASSQQRQQQRSDPRRVPAAASSSSSSSAARTPSASADGAVTGTPSPRAGHRMVIPMGSGANATGRIAVPLGSSRGGAHAAAATSTPTTSNSLSNSLSSSSSSAASSSAASNSLSSSAGVTASASSSAGSGRMVFALPMSNANKRQSLVLAPVVRDNANSNSSPLSPTATTTAATTTTTTTITAEEISPPVVVPAASVLIPEQTQSEHHEPQRHQQQQQQQQQHEIEHRHDLPEQPFETPNAGAPIAVPNIITTPSCDDIGGSRSTTTEPLADSTADATANGDGSASQTSPASPATSSSSASVDPPSWPSTPTASSSIPGATVSFDPPHTTTPLSSSSDPELHISPPHATTAAAAPSTISPLSSPTSTTPSPPPSAAVAGSSAASERPTMGRTLSFTPRSGGARASMTIMLSDTGELQVHQELLNDNQEVTSSTMHSLSTSSNTPSWVNSSVDMQSKRPAVKQSLLSRSPLLFADQKASGKFSVVQTSSEDSPKRKEVIKELIDTERQYVSDLGVIINLFLDPIRRENILSKAEIGALFSNVEALLPVNTGILQDLENPNMSIGKLFQERGDMLKLYAVYCSNQPNIRNLVEAYKSEKEEFGAFLQKTFRRKECRKLDMESFLIKPLQRLCKYPLLLKEVLRFTPETHSDHQAMTEAYDKIKKIVDIVNERVRKVENVIKVAGVENRLINKSDFDLADYNRQFVKEGTIRIDNRDMYAFLFSDTLLICRYPKKGPEDQFVGKRLIPLNMAVLTDIEDTEDRKNAFELAEIGNRIYTLTLANAIEKKSWIKNISGIITALGGSSEAKEQSVTILRRMTIDRQAKSAPLRARAAAAAAASTSGSDTSTSSSSSPSLSPLSLLTPRSGGSGGSEAGRAAIAALEAKVDELTKALESEKALRRQLEAYTKNMSEMFRQLTAENKADKLEEERKRLEEEEALHRKTSANDAATLMQMVEKLTSENLELRAKLKETRAQLKTKET